jgi:hypothetical protein
MRSAVRFSLQAGAQATTIVLIAGCSLATPLARSGDFNAARPTTVELTATSPSGLLTTISDDTGPVRWTVRLDRSPLPDVRLRIRIDGRWISEAQASPELELMDLPFKLKGRRVEKGIWEIVLPANMLQLLSTQAKTPYAGRLMLDSVRTKSVPVELVLEKRSAAQGRRYFRSAG